MFKQFILFIVLFILPLTVPADELTIRKAAPKHYVVKKGDTLWDLSALYLHQSWLWPQLWRLNPQVDNPHLIYPGDVISLSYDKDGRPLLSINPKAKKLSPRGRITAKSSNAIPTLPLKIIQPYLSYDQSLDGDYLDGLPYILGSTENSKNWIDGQIVYVDGPLPQGKTYAIYHQGQEYTNPGQSVVLGYQTKLLGTAAVLRSGTADKPAALRILTSNAEIRAGDKILPINEGQTLPAFFTITRPDVPLNASIIASPTQYREFSKLDVVVLNVGRLQQAKAGNLLNIYHQSPTVLDVNGQPKYLEDASVFDRITSNDDNNGKREIRQMPKEKVGELIIFKVYQNISYALIIAATKPARLGDSTFIDAANAVAAPPNLQSWHSVPQPD